MLGRMLTIMSLAACCWCLAGSADAGTTVTVVHEFHGDPGDGAYPGPSLLAGPGGVVYGTATGISQNGQRVGIPNVFRLIPPSGAIHTWAYEDIHDFTIGNPVLGRWLAADPSGRLYGTLDGYVWRLSPPGLGETKWRYDELYHFGSGADGDGADGVTFFDGSLYGVSTGFSKYGSYRISRYFRLTSPASGQGPWALSVLYTLPVQAGAGPVIVRSVGGRMSLFGLTYRSDGCLFPQQTGVRPADCSLAELADIVAISAPQTPGATWVRQLLGSIRDDGFDETVASPLIADRATNLSGVVGRGGNPDHYYCGVTFRVAPPAPGASNWTYSPLRYCDPSPGPVLPNGPLLNINGVLYGVQEFDGVYKITPVDLGGHHLPWNYASVYKFPTDSNTKTFGSLVQIGSEPHQLSLLGLTYAEGTPNYGTIYKVDVAQ